MDKQLAHIDPLAAQTRAAQGKALSLKELAVVKGISYDLIRDLAKLAGFPVLRGHVWAEDFDLWRQARLGLETVTQHSDAHRRVSTVGRSGK